MVEGTSEKLNNNMNRKTINNKKILLIIFLIIVFFIIMFSTIFAFININNTNIVSGVKIEGIDVSGLSKKEAEEKINLIYDNKIENDILLKYEDYDSSINPKLIETNYKVEAAVEEAIGIGKNKNIIVNNYEILFALMGKKNINVNLTINEEIANQIITDIGSKIPGVVIEPDYYIENEILFITRGKEGLKINTDELEEKIKINLDNIQSNQEYIEIPVFDKEPEEINIEKIYEEVHKEVQDAYYTKNPFTIHPEIEGVDFNLEEAKALLQ